MSDTSQRTVDTVEPYVQYVYQLLDQIAAGRIRVPAFQRPAVWKWDRQQELLRSVRDGIPMGSIMLWETRRDNIASRDQLLGHPLGPPPPGNQTYLLDGLQRLCTLFTALRGSGVVAGASDEVCFDLSVGDFVRREDAEPNATLLPLTRLLKGVDLLRFQRESKLDDDMIARSDELARAFREYKVPVIPIEGDDLDHATRTFKLLNSQGAPMDEVDMVHALTWRNQFNLRDALEGLIETALSPIGWHSVDRDAVLRIVKAQLKIGLYDKQVEQKVADGIRARPSVLDDAVMGVRSAAILLREACGVFSSSVVPYDLQIVLLSDALSSSNVSPAGREAAANWFFLTTHTELFAGLSGARIQKAIESLRMTVGDGKLRWPGSRPPALRDLARTRFDFKSARAKGLALVMARLRDNGSAGHWHQYLGQQGADAVIALVPRLQAVAAAPSPGNRFLCDHDEARVLRAGLAAGSLADEMRAQHLISADAAAAASQGQWHKFIEIRMQCLVDEEQEFFVKLLSKLDSSILSGVGSGR